jgi:hypothetical protein
VIAELPFDACCGFGLSECSLKMKPKMAHEMDAKTMLGHHRVEILRFLDAFWGGGFLVHFRSAKGESNSRKTKVKWEAPGHRPPHRGIQAGSVDPPTPVRLI